MALGYGLDVRGSRVRFLAGLGIFFFTTASRTALEPTQPPIQWVQGVLSLGVKRPGREAGHSPPSSAEVKNEWSYTSTPQYVFMAWCLVKHRENLPFYLPSTCSSQSVNIRQQQNINRACSKSCLKQWHVWNVVKRHVALSWFVRGQVALSMSSARFWNCTGGERINISLTFRYGETRYKLKG
jgi:hypothetical protein